ncbi:hypothetical protein H8959_006185 [Pygathrix nigripes]
MERQTLEDGDWRGNRYPERGGWRLRGEDGDSERGRWRLREGWRPRKGRIEMRQRLDYDERSHLHDAFTQMTHALQELAAAQDPGAQGLFPHPQSLLLLPALLSKRLVRDLGRGKIPIYPGGIQGQPGEGLSSGSPTSTLKGDLRP